jgi:hypothetical protein
MRRRESARLVGRAGPAWCVDILTLMPSQTPANAEGARRGEVRHLADHRRLRRQRSTASVIKRDSSS